MKKSRGELMAVDSFRYLPRIIAFFYQQTDRQPVMPIPWTPLNKPVRDSKFGLVTSGGIYHQVEDNPFNLEREKKEQLWGDPSYRKIPTTITQEEIGVSHLHINTRDILKDVNILLPIDRFQTLVSEGAVRGLADYAFSFMGFQGYPPDTSLWENQYGPRVAEHFLAEGVDCILLTPA
jgi:D-proline reductase (dithiol) PrdB